MSTQKVPEHPELQRETVPWAIPPKKEDGENEKEEEKEEGEEEEKEQVKKEQRSY